MEALPSYLEPTELPGYSSTGPTSPHVIVDRERRRTEHIYTLTGLRKSKPWATLRLKSDASLPDSPPIWIEGQPIKGNLQLSLEKGHGIESVTFNVSYPAQSPLLCSYASHP